MIKVTKKENKAWVTFFIPKKEDISSVELVGEWSEWKNEPMKLKKNGEFSITKILQAGERFQFGYKINGKTWHTDESLPSVPSPFGGENTLLIL